MSPASALHDDLSAFLRAAAAELDVPGAAVGITHRGVDTVAVTGVTSLADPLPVTESTLFMIGSTSKTFTATLAMSLVGEGRLDLDAPLHHYLPEVLDCPEDVRASRAAVRVVDLFTHTAGWVGDGDFDTGPGDDAYARAVSEQLPKVPHHTTGRASYNNLSLVVAARLIETVGGGSYEALLRERVLGPLGLADTYLTSAEVANRRHAVGHLTIDGVQQTMPDWPLPRCFTPTGGVVSTVRDQLAWARFHLTGASPGGVPVDDATREMMRREHATMNPSMHVGINWLLRRRSGLDLVAHGGNVFYQQLSAFAMVPAHEFAVTTLSNARAGEVLGRRVLDWALDRALGVAPAVLPTVQQPADLTEYTGEFGTGDAYVELKIGAGGGLTAANRYREAPELDSPVVAVRFIGDDVVATDDDPAEPAGMFLRDGTGHIDAVRWGLRVGNRLAGGRPREDDPR